MIRVDGEGAIKTEWFHNKVGLKGVVLDVTGAGEAVAVVERKIRHMKKRVRSMVNFLLFSLNEKLEVWLVKYAVGRVVLAPTRNSLNHISPREKLTGRKLDVDKEIKHHFGDYVQVHNDVIDNSTKPRTVGVTALMSSGNLEGSWYYMLFANERIVKRTKATVLPMPDEVILHLNVLASKRKTANVKQPVFENSSHAVFDDDDDVEDDSAYIGDVKYETVDESANTVYTDEIIEDNDHNDNETYPESQLDMSDENHPPTLDEYVDDKLYVSDTTYDNDELYYDDTHASTPKYDQALYLA
jgi:hypothetical protein